MQPVCQPVDVSLKCSLLLSYKLCHYVSFLNKWMSEYKYIKLVGFMRPGREAKCNILSLESDAPWQPPLFLTGECNQSIVAVSHPSLPGEPSFLAVQPDPKTMAQQETSRSLRPKRTAKASMLREWAAIWSFTLEHEDGYCWTPNLCHERQPNKFPVYYIFILALLLIDRTLICRLHDETVF